MKNVYFLLFGLFLFSCSENSKAVSDSSPGETTLEINFDWLSGEWKRTNDEPGKMTFENWIKVKTHEYQGLGYTLVEKDTVFKENMTIRKMENNWNLIVSGVHENPVTFKFTSFTSSQFVAENEKNEFPKKIVYTFKEDKIEAKVSAGEMEIPFYFERILK